MGWGAAVVDAVLGRPNDYFKVYVAAPLDRSDSPAAQDVVVLAETLFTRLSAWYRDEPMGPQRQVPIGGPEEAGG